MNNISLVLRKNQTETVTVDLHINRGFLYFCNKKSSKLSVSPTGFKIPVLLHLHYSEATLLHMQMTSIKSLTNLNTVMFQQQLLKLQPKTEISKLPNTKKAHGVCGVFWEICQISKQESMPASIAVCGI